MCVLNSNMLDNLYLSLSAEVHFVVIDHKQPVKL